MAYIRRKEPESVVKRDGFRILIHVIIYVDCIELYEYLYLCYRDKIRFNVVLFTSEHCPEPSKSTYNLIRDEKNVVLL